MIYTINTRRALQVAQQAHHDQTDKAGFPYILHPILVAEKQTDEVTTIAALLHDVCEDSDITVSDLYEFGIPAEAVEAVKALTHKKGEPYADYIQRVKKNPIARAVKLADLEMNMDPARLDLCSTEARIRLRQKMEVYKLAYDKLKED